MGNPFSTGQKMQRPCGQPRGELITPMTFTPEMLRTFLSRKVGAIDSLTPVGRTLRISEFLGIQLSWCFRQNSSFNLLMPSGSVTPSSQICEASSERSEASVGCSEFKVLYTDT